MWVWSLVRMVRRGGGGGSDSPRGGDGRGGRGREGGGRQGSIVCLPVLAGENCCLDHIAKFSH